jgi:hypothetical protein
MTVAAVPGLHTIRNTVDSVEQGILLAPVDAAAWRQGLTR